MGNVPDSDFKKTKLNKFRLLSAINIPSTIIASPAKNVIPTTLVFLIAQKGKQRCLYKDFYDASNFSVIF